MKRVDFKSVSKEGVVVGIQLFCFVGEEYIDYILLPCFKPMFYLFGVLV